MVLPRQLDSNPCDSALLSRYLDSELSLGDELSVESHLSQCTNCRSAIEMLAAEPEFWTTTAQVLDSLPEANGWRHRIEKFGNRAWESMSELSGIDSDGNAQDAAVEHLSWLQNWMAPSTAAGSIGRIGKYEVLSIIGQGGMGLVLRGLDTELRRVVAIKTMAHHLGAGTTARVRLEREARVAATLHHPHVIAVYGLETWRDVPLIIMPLVEGGNLQDFVEDHPLSLEQILLVAIQIASALASLHASGIVHRDLKPSNVLLQDGIEHVLLSDFGLARADGEVAITQSEALAGTPLFMSPEQAVGKSIDARSDLFSLGSVLYWLFTDRHAFCGENNFKTLSLLVHDEANFDLLKSKQVPEAVQVLIRKLLAKSPEARWQSADHVGRLLQNCLATHRDPHVALMSELSQARRLISRVGLFGSAAALLLVSAVVFGTWQYWTGSSGRFDAHTNQDSSDFQLPGDAHLEVISSDDAGVKVIADEATARGSLPLRYGTLDALDSKVVLADLGSERNVRYWLRRLASLPVDEIPVKALPMIQAFLHHSDDAIRELAQVILNKNPFQEVVGVPPVEPAPTQALPSDENPFQEVLTHE